MVIFFTIGKTTCAMKCGRNCVALEKDEIQASFIQMHVKRVMELPNVDEEVGALVIENNEKFQSASREPLPPLHDEPWELASLTNIENPIPMLAKAMEEVEANTKSVTNEILEQLYDV